MYQTTVISDCIAVNPCKLEMLTTTVSYELCHTKQQKQSWQLAMHDLAHLRCHAYMSHLLNQCQLSAAVVLNPGSRLEGALHSKAKTSREAVGSHALPAMDAFNNGTTRCRFVRYLLSLHLSCCSCPEAPHLHFTPIKNCDYWLRVVFTPTKISVCATTTGRTSKHWSGQPEGLKGSVRQL